MSESRLKISIFLLKRGVNISKIALKNIQTGELICKEALKITKVVMKVSKGRNEYFEYTRRISIGFNTK